MVTLDRLVNVLGSYGVRLRSCPIPRSTELRSVVMHEVALDRTVVGDVLLGIGARTVTEAVRWAASAHAVVVLIRGGNDDTTFGGADEGVAVMVVDPAVSWSELAAVVYGLVLEGRETESGRGPTDLFALADSLAKQSAARSPSRTGCCGCWRIRGCSNTPTRRGWRPSWTAKRRSSCAHCSMPGGIRTSGGVRRSVVCRRGCRTWLDRAHGGGGALGTRTHGVGMGGMLRAAGWGARTALAEGAHTVALHLLRSRASADLERQVESELVIRLLEGPSTPPRWPAGWACRSARCG